MADNITVGYRELTPTGSPRAAESHLDAKTEMDVRGAFTRWVGVGKDYDDPLTVSCPDGSTTQIWASGEDAEILYQAARVARDHGVPLNVYDSQGKKIGELDPSDVMDKLEKWHSRLRR